MVGSLYQSDIPKTVTASSPELKTKHNSTHFCRFFLPITTTQYLRSLILPLSFHVRKKQRSVVVPWYLSSQHASVTEAQSLQNQHQILLHPFTLTSITQSIRTLRCSDPQSDTSILPSTRAVQTCTIPSLTPQQWHQEHSFRWTGPQWFKTASLLSTVFQAAPSSLAWYLWWIVYGFWGKRLW